MPRPVPLLRVADPLMVFGGPYSNLEATRAVLVEAARLEIAADRIICTGDVVAYGADPAATVELVRGSVRHVVMGNCEQSIAADSADCGCGFPAERTWERLSAAWFAHATRHLNADARAWSAAMRRRCNLVAGPAALWGVCRRFARAAQVSSQAVCFGAARCTRGTHLGAGARRCAPHRGRAASATRCRSWSRRSSRILTSQRQVS